MDLSRSVLSKLLGALVVFTGGMFVTAIVAQPRSAAIHMTAEQFQAVLATTTDDSLRIVDLGKYLIGVGMNHRPATKTPGAGAQGRGNAPASGTARGNAAGRANQSPATPCGVAGTPSANGVPGGIMHTVAAETYVITSGAGMLVTGGHIVNGRASTKGSALETIQNGPSCTGTIDGPDVVKRMVKAGDAIIIPPNTPHGWEFVPDHVDYVSIRTDPDKVMTANFVHPIVAKMLEKK